MNNIKKVSFFLTTATILASCGPIQLEKLNTLIVNSLEYLDAIALVTSNQRTENDLKLSKFNPKSVTDESVVRYFLLKYQSVKVSYDILTPTETIANAVFEIRGEVFLTAIRENRVSITSSMPVLNNLFISIDQLEAMEEINDEFKSSDDYLISPFLTKYRYGSAGNDGFAYELHDFSSTGGGLVTSQTRVDFGYSNNDNRLEKWQFTFFNKTEQTGGTDEVTKTIEVNFEWTERTA
jgi:hypothetical protein